MEEQTPFIEKSPPERQDPGWRHFLLYLLAGFGLYALATGAAAAFFGEITIWLTFTVTLISLLILGGSYFVFGAASGHVSAAEIGLYPPRWKASWIWWGALISIFVLPLRSLLGVLVEMLLSGDLESLTLRSEIIAGGEGFSWLNFGLSLVGVGLIVPVAEELYFRGLLHGFLMKRIGFAARVLLSSLLFGLAHFDSLAVVISSFVLGLIIAVVFEKTRSIWPAIAIHSVTNLIGVILLFLTLANS